jgi:bacterioferritin-associated ferredoxin
VILCHCALVSDRAVRRAVAEGAADLEALAASCGGAGADCGGCRRALRSVLAACAATDVETDADADVAATPVRVRAGVAA